MDRISRPQRLEGATAGDCLLKVPIMRGCGGDVGRDWMIVGSGKKLKAIKKYKVKIETSSGDIEEEWKNWGTLLSPEFVGFVKTSKFIRYLCSNCLGHI